VGDEGGAQQINAKQFIEQPICMVLLEPFEFIGIGFSIEYGFYKKKIITVPVKFWCIDKKKK